MIKKNRKPITCTKAPRRSQHYEIQRSVRPQRRQHFRGVCILHIHQLISSTARSSSNKRSQKPRETRKNHTRANNFRRLGNNGRTLITSILNWLWMGFNRRQTMWSTLKGRMLTTLCSSRATSCSATRLEPQGSPCVIEIPHNNKSRRRSRAELEEVSIWLWNKVLIILSWNQMTCSILRKPTHWTFRWTRSAQKCSSHKASLTHGLPISTRASSQSREEETCTNSP